MILADEPTGNLDTKTGNDIVELLAGLAARHGTTVIVATHDAELAARADPRIAMRDGRVVSEPRPPDAAATRRPRTAAERTRRTSRGRSSPPPTASARGSTPSAGCPS